jgi:hypothetical protein
MTPSITLAKPRFSEPCNGCGYCCTAEPCGLAEDILNCHTGPCAALETRDGRTQCGLVRNPLGYLFKAAHPDSDVPVLDDAPDMAQSRELSAGLAAVLGIGKGCDAEDDEDSAKWPVFFRRA